VTYGSATVTNDSLLSVGSKRSFGSDPFGGKSAVANKRPISSTGGSYVSEPKDFTVGADHTKHMGTLLVFITSL
jgi:hypothetical protein